MKRAAALTAGFFVLCSCGGSSDQGGSGASAPEAASEFSFRDAGDMTAIADFQAAAPPPPPPPPPPRADDVGPPDETPTSGQYIAYSHAVGLQLPSKQIEPLMETHLQACRDAGPAACLIIRSYLNNDNEDYVSADVSIKATPDWIDRFLAEIDAAAEAANGRVATRSTSSEDLTRAILDTDARLRAQTTLRSRLEALLSTNEADLGELLDLERELARVNGQIESVTSNLKALRLRVSLSDLNVSYRTQRSFVDPGRGNPLFRAFGDFFYNLSAAMAAVVTAFAVGLPWLLLVGVMLWIWLRLLWPRIRRRKATTPSKS